MANIEEISQLHVNQLCGIDQPAGRQAIDSWLDESPGRRQRLAPYLQPDTLAIELFKDDESFESAPRIGIKKIIAWSAVAALFIGAMIILPKLRTPADDRHFSAERSILPIGKLAQLQKTKTDRILLTLADGSLVNVEETEGKKLGQQAGYRIIKEDATHLAYLAPSDSTVNIIRPPNIYNTLSLPSNASSMEVLLPDGSRVTMGPGSTVYFPVEPLDPVRYKRIVAMAGEALFNVTASIESPFLVETRNIEAKVKGTIFQVRDYGSGSIGVASLTGKVEVNDGVKSPETISDGQYAFVADYSSKAQAETPFPLLKRTWAPNVFEFTDRNIGSVMREIADWYGMELKYQDQVDTVTVGHIGGPLPRSLALRTLLDYMTTAHRHFVINGDMIIVKK